ncbi:MAG: hypothetical protein A3H57_01405 [Candidatus Taylorbacteria bacterium RIFCSPLOWO2_02_FULL_43_11]|uniref:Glycosyl transferase family 1 domain-containing protein n=1 Tax=Candidatus Taylorbacteria bacterium RIFCSPHIGHO2_02_FULL_43_32b TaxID=1802306 RepID=A0A1G2ML70_9BACT|nr:MAG: hypothetical protein A3C72_01830 [Candidatus Taylorbacteria bacterium RIFCSPHIGHO2_02_FULL_43_32b]OHA35833.1 MAG: hypothetical protein A3H57_01405 [Candidatus Taylorbacteria bacterium RIFCSPLOWO2_02_FULL_43_11]
MPGLDVNRRIAAISGHPMRIFFVTSKLNFKKAGGSVEEFDLMIREFQRLGNEVTVVTVFSQNNEIDRPLPYKVIEEKVLSRGLLGIQWHAYKILRKYQNEADIFHIDGHLLLYGAGLYRRLGGKVPVEAFFNRELIFWPQITSSLFPQNEPKVIERLKIKLRSLVEKNIGMPLANGIDLFSFISPMFKEMYENFGLRRDPKSLVINDPIDFGKIMRENSIVENSYLKRNKFGPKIKIFYSSRMAPGKGFDILLKGFSLVRNKDDFELILGGTGPEEQYVKDMIREYKLDPYVTLLGWVSKEKLYQLHREADIFVQADWLTYGTSISLLYAMIFGIPCILPAGGGLQWIADGAALYFKNRDTEELALRIEELGRDRELRAKLSMNCYRRLKDDEMNYVKQVGRLFRAVEEMKSDLK